MQEILETTFGGDAPPTSLIVTEDQSETTVGNAINCQEILNEHGIN